MKKIYFIGALLATAFSFAQFTEDFPGTAAISTTGWTTHSGTAGQLTPSTGSLAYSTINTSGNKISLVAGNSEDVNKSVGTAISTIGYYSAIINFPNTTGLTTTGDYSLAFGGTTGATVTNLPARLYFKTGGASDTFNIGVVNQSGTGSTPSYDSTDFSIGTPVFVVVKYDRGTNTAYLFINPALNTTEPSATLTNNSGGGAAPAQIASLAIRQAGNSTAGTGNVEFDALRAADNWAYVTTSTLLSNNEFNDISGLKVYPNPAKNTLYVTSDSFAAKQVELFDVLGKSVLNTKVVNNTVNISSLSKGVYVAKITEEGKTATRKVVVE